MTDEDEEAAANRGSRPLEGSGEVKGSGAGAGGGGNPEDFDQDPAAGGTAPGRPSQAEGDDDLPPPQPGSPKG